MSWESDSRHSPAWLKLSEQGRKDALGLAHRHNVESGTGGLTWSNTFKVGRLTCELSISSDDPILKAKWWPQAPKTLPLKKEHAKQWLDGRAVLYAQITEDIGGGAAIIEV